MPDNIEAPTPDPTEVADNMYGEVDKQGDEQQNESAEGKKPEGEQQDQNAEDKKHEGDNKDTEGGKKPEDKDTSTLLSGDKGGAEGDTADNPNKDWQWQPPEGYEVSETDKALIGETAAELGKLGVTDPADLQRLADLHHKHMTEANDNLADDWGRTMADWREKATKDAEIYGGSDEKFKENIALANKAVKKWGSPELEAMLAKPTDNPNGLGIGDNPEFIRFALRAALSGRLNEDTIVNSDNATGTGGSGLDTREERAEALYGDED